MPAPPPHEPRCGTRAEAFVATLGLSLLFLMLACVFQAGAQQGRDLTANANANIQGNMNVARPSNSVLRGRVTYADTGQPVRRARVFLFGELSPSPSLSATNRAGEFVFKGLVAGRYFLYVESPGIIAPSVSAEEMQERTPYEALAARRTRLDFIEASVNGTNDSYVEFRARRGGVIAGKVVYDDGTPVASARLILFRRRDGVWKHATFGTVLKPDAFSTDARGIYRISGLPPGEYLVSASESIVNTDGNDEGAEGSYANSSFVLNFHPNATKIAGAQPVRVHLGQETNEVDILFATRELRTLSGTVTARRGGEPIANAMLKLHMRDDALTSTGYPLVSVHWSDPQGHWWIRGVPDGVYRLSAERYPENEEEELPVQAEGRKWRPRYYSATEMEIKVEGDMSNVAVRMAEASMVYGKVSVEGRRELPRDLEVLLTPQAAPVPSAPLVTLKSLLQLLDRDGLKGYGTSYEPETGDFLLWRVPAGNAYLSVLLPPDSTHYVKSIVWKTTDLLREPLRVAEGVEVNDVRIVLGTGAGTVAGRVLRKAGGEETARAVSVALIPVDALRRRIVGLTRFAQTDDEGRYLLSDAPGEYYVVALPVVEEEVEEGPAALSESYIREHAATLPRVTLKLRGKESLDLVLTDVQPR